MSKIICTQTRTGWEAHLPESMHPAIVHVAEPGSWPRLHPLRAVDGRVLTEDAPAHHPWQHGLYCGLNDIDGTGFWTGGLCQDAHRLATDGRIRCTGSEAVNGGWAVSSDWCAADGRVLLRDRLEVRPGTDAAGWWLDLDWKITAVGRRRFGRYDYGGLFLRMPIHERTVCELLTDTGCRDRAVAEGGRFRWVALSIHELGDPPAGLAIIDHPGNDGWPAPWRVDGQFGIGPSPCREGERMLEDGAHDRRRYRIAVLAGQPDSARIQALIPGDRV